jgi:hypothetical protein
MIWLRLRRTCIAGNETSTLTPSQSAVSSLRLQSFRPPFSFETALALFSKRLLETGILHAHLSIDLLQAVVLFSYRVDLKQCWHPSFRIWHASLGLAPDCRDLGVAEFSNKSYAAVAL